MIHYKKVMERFQIPEEGKEILGKILTEEEQVFLSEWDDAGVFSDTGLIDFLCSRKLMPNRQKAEEFIENCFRRGVLNKSNGNYCVGNFYGRLDIFATSEAEVYRSISQEKRKELDRWYFERYLERLGELAVERPTEDEVLPLDETLAFIEKKTEQPYLALCDCRMLTGDCNSPTRTCITYRTAENSFVSRGHAVPITKEEAKQVVLDSDRAGLMHTVNPGGVCNCCTDCCYLFRAAQARQSQGVWPKSRDRIALNADKCIGCGACVRRCHFQVLEKAGTDKGQAAVLVRGEACVGCGICVTGCPTGALHLEQMKKQEFGGNQ